MAIELEKEFEATGYTSWINSDIYPDGKIHTKEYTEWLEKQTSQLREELEAAKKDNEEFKREFTEAMDDVARLGGENEKLQKEIERVKLILKNCVSCGYYSNWETFKSNHNL